MVGKGGEYWEEGKGRGDLKRKKKSIGKDYWKGRNINKYM